MTPTTAAAEKRGDSAAPPAFQAAGLLPGGIGPTRANDPTWCLVVGEKDDDLDDAKARVAESLLCVSDGVIGTRGVL